MLCRCDASFSVSINCACVIFNYPCQFSAVASCYSHRLTDFFGCRQLYTCTMYTQERMRNNKAQSDMESIRDVYVYEQETHSEIAYNHIGPTANSQQITITDRHIHAVRTNYFRFRSIASFFVVVAAARWTSARRFLYADGAQQPTKPNEHLRHMSMKQQHCARFTLDACLKFITQKQMLSYSFAFLSFFAHTDSYVRLVNMIMNLVSCCLPCG